MKIEKIILEENCQNCESICLTLIENNAQDHFVKCDDCGATGPKEENAVNAITKWSDR